MFYHSACTGGDIMSQLFLSKKDFAKYLGCMCGLMVGNCDLETEGNLVALLRFKDGGIKLCLLQIRCYTGTSRADPRTPPPVSLLLRRRVGWRRERVRVSHHSAADGRLF
jgi:hypothetical protein